MPRLTKRLQHFLIALWIIAEYKIYGKLLLTLVKKKEFSHMILFPDFRILVLLYLHGQDSSIN